MRRIYLIRHGMTEANLRHLYHGSTDLDLCETGKTAPNPMALERTPQFITSGMKRTEQTLRILFGDVPHETDPRFREMDFGVFEMKSYQDLKDDPAYQTWITGDNNRNQAPAGESGEIMTRRVLEGFDALLEREGDLVLVTHGGPICAIMAHLFCWENKNRYQWQPPCGGGYILTQIGNKWSYQPIH